MGIQPHHAGLGGSAAADLIIPRGGADRVLAGSGNDRVVAQYDGAVDTMQIIDDCYSAAAFVPRPRSTLPLAQGSGVLS